MTVEETQGQTWLAMGSMTQWVSGKMHEETWKLNTEEGDWWWSAAEGKSTGEVNEPDGRVRGTKENMAITKD